ncbi:MAG: hypothetical protein ABIH39_01880, partial [Candidatus Margulisiibacteriota bacterium]
MLKNLLFKIVISNLGIKPDIHKYILDNNQGILEVTVTESADIYTLIIRTDIQNKTWLHWGIALNSEYEWIMPDNKIWPQGTTPHSGAVQTLFQPSPDGKQEFRLTLAKEDIPQHGINFILTQGPDKWIKVNNSDIHIPMPATAYPISIFTEDFENIADINARNKSYRHKLDWIRNYIIARAKILNIKDLTNIAVYLRFLASGSIKCEEDGEHFRPNNHAQMAENIVSILVNLTHPGNALLIRNIYQYLPSYDSEYKVAVPLTRIRAIAHRNDIPSLKERIKKELQNPLHRCATPKHLEISERFLSESRRDYPHNSDLIHEFETFHEELKTFFNVPNLENRLKKLIDIGDPNTRLIDMFLKAKSANQDQLVILKHLTELRSEFISRAENDPGAQAQNLRIADIEMEQFAFVAISRLMGDLEESKGTNWKTQFELIDLIVKNLRLSEIINNECIAIEEELAVLARGVN